jgi:hypothetical protein
MSVRTSKRTLLNAHPTTNLSSQLLDANWDDLRESRSGLIGLITEITHPPTNEPTILIIRGPEPRR